jgi:K+-sensing histidine kinase KdpD
MNKKLVFFVLILFIIGLVGDQITTRLYYKNTGDDEKKKDEINPNPDIPMIKPPSLFDQNPLKIPTIKSNTWMVYDAIIACFACLVTFALVSKSDDNESIKIVTLVFIFLILLSATLKLMNMLTHITSMY